MAYINSYMCWSAVIFGPLQILTDIAVPALGYDWTLRFDYWYTLPNFAWAVEWGWQLLDKNKETAKNSGKVSPRSASAVAKMSSYRLGMRGLFIGRLHRKHRLRLPIPGGCPLPRGRGAVRCGVSAPGVRRRVHHAGHRRNRYGRVLLDPASESESTCRVRDVCRRVRGIRGAARFGAPPVPSAHGAALVRVPERNRHQGVRQHTNKLLNMVLRLHVPAQTQKE